MFARKALTTIALTAAIGFVAVPVLATPTAATAAVTEAPSCVKLAGQIVMTHDYAGTTAQHLCFGEEDSTTVDMLLTISSHGAASLGYGSWSEADRALGYAVTIDLGWCTQATIDQDLCS